MPEFPLTVGIGLDAGEAVRVGDGYRGGALNLAARLCGQARAGEILGSREVTHLARAVDGVRYEDRGEMRFKNLTEPVSVVRIVATDGERCNSSGRSSRSLPPSRRSRTAIVAVPASSRPRARRDRDPHSYVRRRRDDPLAANSLTRLDPEDGSVDAAFELDLQPGEMAIGFDSVWVVESESDRVVRLRLGDGIGSRHDPGRSVTLWHRDRRRRRLGDERCRRDCRPDRRRDEHRQPDAPRGLVARGGSRSATARCGSPTTSAPRSCGSIRSPGIPTRSSSTASRPPSRSRPKACGSRSRRAAWPGSRAITSRSSRTWARGPRRSRIRVRIDLGGERARRLRHPGRAVDGHASRPRSAWARVRRRWRTRVAAVGVEHARRLARGDRSRFGQRGEHDPR